MISPCSKLFRHLQALAVALCLSAPGAHAGAASVRSTVCLENTTAHPVTLHVAEVESYDFEKERPDHTMHRNVLASGALGCWPQDTNSHASFPAFSLAFEGYGAWDRFVLIQGSRGDEPARWAVQRKPQTMVRGDARRPGPLMREFEFGYPCNPERTCSLFRITDATLAAPERLIGPPELMPGQTLMFSPGRLRLERLDALRVASTDAMAHAYQLMLQASANLTVHACHDPACTRGALIWESAGVSADHEAFASFEPDGHLAVHAYPTEPAWAALWRSPLNPSLDRSPREETRLLFGGDGVLRIERVSDSATLWRSDARP